MAKFTISDFRKQYATDAACLDKIFTLRYGKLEACPECQCPASFRRITTRRAYQCKHCYTQFYPTAGTVFEKTRTPLADWFYVIYLFTATRNGVSAKEIQRQLGVTYKTAFRMGHCIRTLIGGMDATKLKGFVELDETFYNAGSDGNRQDKAVVFGMVERGGNVKAVVVPDAKAKSLMPIIKDNIDVDANVNTDDYAGYIQLTKVTGIAKHNTINHSNGRYRIGSACTNTIEGYWSHLKRMLYGTHISVSPKYLQNYVNENSFRYNHRNNQGGMFEAVIERMPIVGQ